MNIWWSPVAESFMEKIYEDIHDAKKIKLQNRSYEKMILLQIILHNFSRLSLESSLIELRNKPNWITEHSQLGIAPYLM